MELMLLLLGYDGSDQCCDHDHQPDGAEEHDEQEAAKAVECGLHLISFSVDGFYYTLRNLRENLKPPFGGRRLRTDVLLLLLVWLSGTR